MGFYRLYCRNYSSSMMKSIIFLVDDYFQISFNQWLRLLSSLQSKIFLTLIKQLNRVWFSLKSMKTISTNWSINFHPRIISKIYACHTCVINPQVLINFQKASLKIDTFKKSSLSTSLWQQLYKKLWTKNRGEKNPINTGSKETMESLLFDL